jgi:membrane protease YdiL (CAAX protease family)
MKGVIWFLVICFGLAWASWEIAIASGISVLSWQFQLYALPGAFAPAIAAIVVRKWITREGFGDAGLGLHAARWPIYLFAWLLPLAVVAVIVVEAVALGVARPDFTLMQAMATGDAGHSLTALRNPGLWVVPQLMAMAILMTPVLWGEEFGWRGYLQARIFAGRPVLAALATGLIWGVWHYPVTLRGYDFPGHPIVGSLLLTACAVPLAYIFGWIRARSGSIWAPSLAHAATNSIGGLTILWLAGAKNLIMISYVGVLAIPPLLLVCSCLFRADRRSPFRRGGGSRLGRQGIGDKELV